MARSKPNQIERRAINRVLRVLEARGFVGGFCAGVLRETFDLIADPRFLDLRRGTGAYIKVDIEQVSREALERILKYETPRRKELWVLLKQSEKKTAPGSFMVFQFEDKRLISGPKDYPLEHVVKKKSTSEKI